MSNAHVATFDSTNALVTWEEIADPFCEYIAMGCRGTFTGSFFQLVDSTGTAVGTPLQKTDVYVSGDLVTMNDGRICWPYVNMEWSLSDVVGGYGGYTASNVTSMSFACMSSGSSAAASSSTTASAAASASVAASSSAAPAASSSTVAEAAAVEDPISSVSSSAAAVVTYPAAAPTTLETSTVAASAAAEQTSKVPCNRHSHQ